MVLGDPSSTNYLKTLQVFFVVLALCSHEALYARRLDTFFPRLASDQFTCTEQALIRILQIDVQDFLETLKCSPSCNFLVFTNLNDIKATIVLLVLRIFFLVQVTGVKTGLVIRLQQNA